MPDGEEIQKQNIGNAGEYYVAALLSARNFTTTLTLGRAERYDILAVAKNGKTYKFSVKSRLSEERSAFTLSEGDEKKAEPDLFYVFVRLHRFEKIPDFWIIPSTRVVEVITSAHKKWSETPGKHGQPHNHSSVRKIPVVIGGGMDQIYYPKEWESEMQTYYKNFAILN